MERKIYVVGGADNYCNWMKPTRLARTIEEADLVVFTGGEDVTPAFYGEPRHPTTHSNWMRDSAEQFQFKQAKALGKRLVGICRGSQFLCVMAGGKLVQHQKNPFYIHPMHVFDGPDINVTSTHHQAQYPWALQDAKLIGWTDNISRFHYDGNGDEIVNGEQNGKTLGIEVEIMYYPNIKALAIQSHPEMVYGDPKHDEYITYMQLLLDKHLADKL